MGHYWNSDTLDDDEKFLRDYILKRQFVNEDERYAFSVIPSGKVSEKAVRWSIIKLPILMPIQQKLTPPDLPFTVFAVFECICLGIGNSVVFNSPLYHLGGEVV